MTYWPERDQPEYWHTQEELAAALRRRSIEAAAVLAVLAIIAGLALLLVR